MSHLNLQSVQKVQDSAILHHGSRCDGIRFASYYAQCTPSTSRLIYPVRDAKSGAWVSRTSAKDLGPSARPG